MEFSWSDDSAQYIKLRSQFSEKAEFWYWFSWPTKYV